MAEMKLLVIAGEGGAGGTYEEALSRIAVACDIAPSLKEAVNLAVGNAYSGVMIDMVTLVRSSKEEKLIAYHLLEVYPSIRVRVDAVKKQMRLGLLEQCHAAHDVEASLRFFLKERCTPFQPRPFRRHKRSDICLNAILSSDRAFSEETCTKTFTVNVSRGGAFLHTTYALEPGERVWLRFLELSDQTPIEATVRWHRAWGTARSISGLGVAFKSLTASQGKELQELAGV